MKIYLDTSVISALFDIRNPERKSLTEAFIMEIDNYDVYISDLTVAEIERTPDIVLQAKMLEMIIHFARISLSNDVEWLANEYVKHGAIPESYPEDAYHIAIAVINDIDFLLSWNYKHLVRRKTRDIVRMLNTLNKLRQIEIITPAELL